MAFRHNALLEASQQCPAKQRKKKLFLKQVPSVRVLKTKNLLVLLSSSLT
jgi:hypothetical protein